MSVDQGKIGHLVDEGLATIQTGPFGTQLKASDYVPEGVPVINVRNVGYGDLRDDKIEFVTEATAERLAVHVLATNDIVFGRKGAVDRHLFVSTEQAGWVQGSDCIRLRFATERISPRFVSYAFLRPYHKEWMLQQCGNKATMASLNQDVIRRITLPLPRRDQQDEVVSVLSAYDDLIENNRRRVALLEEAARMLYREWFVRFRFPGHEHVKIIDGLPEGWERRTLGSVLNLQRGFDLPVGDRIAGGVPVHGSTGIVGEHNVPKVSFPTLVTGRSGSLGTVCFVDDPCWPLNTSLWVTEFKAVSVYFAYFMLSEMNLAQFNGGASVPTLDRKVVHAANVVVPPRLLCTLFDEQARILFSQRKCLDRQNQKLTETRDLVLPRLMNGEIAV